MTCPQCEHIIDQPGLPHVIRTCGDCGRIMQVHEPGKHGRGLKVTKGDQFVVPQSWLQQQLFFNPLKSTAMFSRSGLDWLAKSVMLEEVYRKQNSFTDELFRLENWCEEILRGSSLLQGLDLENDADADKVLEILKNRDDLVEWWALHIILYVSLAKESIGNGDASSAAWAIACVERFRTIIIFRQELEEAVWIGQSAKRIIEALRIWDKHQTDNDEKFWQSTFKENSYVLSQVFAVPIIHIQDNSYVGGMQIDRTEAKYADYLFSSEFSGEAILVEIKAPNTKLLGAQYRKAVYPPASGLSGAVIQVLDYRTSLIRNVERLGHDLKVSNPRCVVIAGNSQQQLDSKAKRESFELYRRSLKDVEIVTYDELFRKVEVLASLFNLSRKRAE